MSKRRWRPTVMQLRVGVRLSRSLDLVVMILCQQRTMLSMFTARVGSKDSLNLTLIASGVVRFGRATVKRTELLGPACCNHQESRQRFVSPRRYFQNNVPGT